MRPKTLIYLMMIALLPLSACSNLFGAGENELQEHTPNDEVADQSEDDPADEDSDNSTEKDNNNGADGHDSNDLLSEDHEPNVPDGPNVPDTPEGASPNVPDGPNIPDFPDVDLPNVDIDGDEDEITMQVPDTLLFDFDKSDLKSEAKETLHEVGLALVEYDNADVQINGHTDNHGDDDYNMKLSEERAEAVKEYLEEQGALEQVSVKTKGYGKTKPIASNDSEKGQQKNRRVEIVIEPSK